MSFLERAKQAASQAATQAASAVDRAGQATAGAFDQVGAKATDPTTVDAAKRVLGRARTGLSTAIDRIDPSVLADVIVKATALQEKANAALKAKGSPYRIDQIQIGAAIPPSVSFSIGRVDDPDAGVASTALVAATAHDGAIRALDGSELDEAAFDPSA